jgi:Ca2+-binding RTX toxin-like protein
MNAGTLTRYFAITGVALAGALFATTQVSAAPGNDADAPARPGGSPVLPLLTCNGKVATMVGTSGDDTFHAYYHADVIVALGGDDVILGAGGDDTICAGDGDDVIFAGPGNDYVDGGNGEDLISGESGDDSLHGGADNDSVFGGTGNDFIVDGGGSYATLYGDAGNDSIFVPVGDSPSWGSEIWGGPGDDLIGGGATKDKIYGGEDKDTIFGEGGDDWIRGGCPVDTGCLEGSDGKDVIHGGAGDDYLNAAFGEYDQLFGDESNDSMYGTPHAKLTGGAGTDTMVGWGVTYFFANDNEYDTITADRYFDECHVDVTSRPNIGPNDASTGCDSVIEY